MGRGKSAGNVQEVVGKRLYEEVEQSEGPGGGKDVKG